ncbi:MAG: hypothetical protein GY719_36615 [bacterium]|nr:hypothetical protein [bacterium]
MSDSNVHQAAGRFVACLVLLLGSAARPAWILVCVGALLATPPAAAAPELEVQIDTIQTQDFPAPYGHGVRIDYSLLYYDPGVDIVDGYHIQVDEGNGWRDAHNLRPPGYSWANIHGNVVCCPDRFNLPSGADVQVRMRTKYHTEIFPLAFPGGPVDKALGPGEKWTPWSPAVTVIMPTWAAGAPCTEAFQSAFVRNILPWDYGGAGLGLKTLLAVPPSAPGVVGGHQVEEVTDYVLRDGGREVGTVAANADVTLAFSEIDDTGRQPDIRYDYQLAVQAEGYATADASCQRIAFEEEIAPHHANELRSRTTPFADGLASREAALHLRPLLAFDAAEIYWPVSIEYLLASADMASFTWSGGPQLTVLAPAGGYTERDLMIEGHKSLNEEDDHRWEAWHTFEDPDSGILLDLLEYPHPQYWHMVDSNNEPHNMGAPPAAFQVRPGCETANVAEWYYDCHDDRDAGRDLWRVGSELTRRYRAPHPDWKLYYTVHPYDADGNGVDDDGEYEIVYQMWSAWDASWEDGDSLGVGASEFITRHEGDQTTIRVYTSDHGKTARFVTGGMHGMPLYVVGHSGTIKDRGHTGPQEFRFYGSQEIGQLDNLFLYEEGRDPYLQRAYRTPDTTFKQNAYWNFTRASPGAVHPVMFIGSRSHGGSPLPGVLLSTLKAVTVLPPLIFVDAHVRDAFTGTGLRWFPSDGQLVPIELDHPEFFHYIGWTGNWDRQVRRGPDPGWIQEVTPPRAPQRIFRRGSPPDPDAEPVQAGERRVLWWDGDTTDHGPEGPFKWDQDESDPSFVGASCVGVDYLTGFPLNLFLQEASCAAYCDYLGATCTESCTTNRGFPNWGVEAWGTTSQCQSYATSGGQARCTTDLSIYGSWNQRKYRCCCG